MTLGNLDLGYLWDDNQSHRNKPRRRRVSKATLDAIHESNRAENHPLSPSCSCAGCKAWGVPYRYTASYCHVYPFSDWTRPRLSPGQPNQTYICTRCRSYVVHQGVDPWW